MAQYLEDLLAQEPQWGDLLAYLASGRPIPAALGLELPTAFQGQASELLARRILCHHGDGCGNCPSCMAWVEGRHPDWLLAGSPGDAPPVELCRDLSGELMLSPVTAPVRLLTVYSAEALNPSAANSLLKVTEEPPPRGRLLYLMASGALLPTLRSRLWVLSFRLEERLEPLEPPQNGEAWLRWLSEGEKRNGQDWYAMALGYVAWLRNQGKAQAAAQLRQLAEIALTTHLSSAMWADLLCLFLREEYPFDHVFDDFRQASIFGAGRDR